MLLQRQRLVLELLDHIGEPVSLTDFQKLLFLYSMEVEEVPSYEFVPYQFGGFSFTSYADKRGLIAKGFLKPDDSKWAITPEGRKAVAAGPQKHKNVSSFLERYLHLRGDALIRRVYLRFPYYATRSRITKRVLCHPDEFDAVERERPPQPSPGIVTIGYEGKSLEAYLNSLLRDSVTILCDVRNNPLSRKYGFSKRSLKEACEKVGIRYEHLPKLGIPSERRRVLETDEDYRSLFEEYVRELLPNQSEPLALIQDWLTEGHRVALTCYEALPCNCHRHCVANILHSSFRKDIPIVHL